MEARHARLQAGPAGIIPEEVIVLETVGPISDFIVAVRNASMEWLGEIEEEDIPPDDDFFVPHDKTHEPTTKTMRGRLFLVLSNQQALHEMVSLWERWNAGQALPFGWSKWGDLFARLRDVRPWGVQDRLLETGILDDWRERAAHGQEAVPCEIELWYRRNYERRLAARERVSNLIGSLQGQVVREATIDEIGYHGLLAILPIGAVSEFFDEAGRDAELVQCEQIQFFRASGQMAGVIVEEARTPDQSLLPEGGTALGPPVVALFDGLPLQNHQRLARRLEVDDPDGFEEDYPANERRHGTAMASLILHGDLEAGLPPLPRRLYVRPILRPPAADWLRNRMEVAPENTLVLDVIHRAVRRLFESEGDEGPAAPEVCVINLSIGINDRPFNGAMSPLARLLDWLAWRYHVLFVVSAGNHNGTITLPVSPDEAAKLGAADFQACVVRAVAADARNRRLVSPAEALNVLTVGAANTDESAGVDVAGAVVPFVDDGMPSVINTQGMGYRRSIKPDILAPGGRAVLIENLPRADEAAFRVYDQTRRPGQRVAAPGPNPGDLAYSWYTRGTSGATALVSRLACIHYDEIGRLAADPGGEILEQVPMALWLKTLLVHGARWGTAGDVLTTLLRTAANSRQFKEYLTRLLGYGLVDAERVNQCTETRVTALGGGWLQKDQAHVHRFPLPPSLSGKVGRRELAITLTWLTPVNPAHQGWRRADLWFQPPADTIGVARAEADWHAVQRGTTQHEVLSGERAIAFVDGDNLEIQVSCRSDAGALEEAVPYALAVTLEVPPALGIDIYDEIRVRIENVRVAIAAGV